MVTTLDILSYAFDNSSMIFIFLLIFFLYNHYTSTHDYFRERGVPFKKPRIIVGNLAPRIFLQTSFHEFNIHMYKYFEGLPYGGFFEGRRPMLVLRSPELIKAVMIKDFDHFVDRHIIPINTSTSLNKMLVSLKGKEWKKVRAQLTPTFSSGKLRAMENLLQQCGDQMYNFLNNRPEGDTDLDMKEFIGRYTLEVIGSCAFGLDCDSLKDPNAGFVKVASKFNDIHIIKRMILFFCIVLAPGLIKYLPITFSNEDVVRQLEDVVNKTKEDREKNIKNRRNDFMQLLLDSAENEAKEETGEKVMTEKVIQAQAVLFLFAGYETTSTLLSFACAVLCEYPDIQEKLREEIQKVADKNMGKCTYDSINEIPLLEMVLLETLRMYPPVSRVDRTCTKPYTLPGTNLTINKDDVVVIPIVGMLHDPDYYPDPEIFNPERFSPEERARRPGELFLPFGMGPRNCIGLRFAMMSAKFGMFYLLKDFKLTKCARTQYPIEYDRRSFLLKAKNGAWMKVEPIK